VVATVLVTSQKMKVKSDLVAVELSRTGGNMARLLVVPSHTPREMYHRLSDLCTTQHKGMSDKKI